MNVHRPAATATAPPEWATGTVHLDAIASPQPPSHLLAGLSHFAPGARTVWHTHPLGQTLLILEGVGLVQRRGGPACLVRAGDRVVFEPGEEHWHGAAPDHLMAHLALSQTDADGVGVSWLDPVTDDDYATAAATAGRPDKEQQ